MCDFDFTFAVLLALRSRFDFNDCRTSCCCGEIDWCGSHYGLSVGQGGRGYTSNPSCKMTKRQPLFSGPGARDVDRTTGRNVSSITLDFKARQIAVSCFDLLFSSFSCMCVHILYDHFDSVCVFLFWFFFYGKKLATVKDFNKIRKDAQDSFDC